MSEAEYWSDYYESRAKQIEPPSLFAQATAAHFKDSIRSVLEVGCGSGRDAYYLGTQYKVLALDIANKPSDTDNCTFQQKSMEELTGEHDLLYSRFSLHSVSENTEESVLRYALAHCRYIALEVRSVKDEVGQNKNEKNESRDATSYAAAHYRRFFDFEKTKQKMETMGFILIVAEESNDFAPYKGQRPYCIRIIARTSRD